MQFLSSNAGGFRPRQTPPPTGFNSYNDGADIWVSFNGSAWKKAHDCMRAQAYMNVNNPSIPVNANLVIPWDTIDYNDPAGGMSIAGSQYNVNLAGIYLAQFRFYISTSVTPTNGTAVFPTISRNGVANAIARGTQYTVTSPTGAVSYELLCHALVALLAGDTLQASIFQNMVGGGASSTVTGYATILNAFAVHWMSPL